MELTDPVDAQRAELTAEREKLDADAQAVTAALAASESAIETERAEVRRERELAAQKVPGELWPEYDELRSQLGGVAIARLVGTTCQGCHLALSAVEVDRIRKLSPDETVHCEECGRLLVRD